MQRCLWMAVVMACVAMPMRAATGGLRFLLVGDSTVAEKSGWGPAFCQDVTPGVTCVNMALGGRSSKSYRADGTWAKVLDQLKNNGHYAVTYVLIQFGHNDQPGKPGRSTDLKTEFPANMKGFVTEVKATGAVPVLVTPLSRRSWTAEGTIRDTLGPWADADKAVASETGTVLLDLHAASIAALEKMGKDEGNTLAMAPPPGKDEAAPTTSVEIPGEAKAKFDGTHLGAKGASFFAAIVEQELVAAIPNTRSAFRKAK